MAEHVIPRDGQGFRAEVKVGNEIQFILMATYSALGFVAEVHNAKGEKLEGGWVEENTFDAAKAKAEAMARKKWDAIGRREQFPSLNWKATG